LAIFAVPLVLCLAGDNKQPLSTGITAIAAIAGLVNAGIGIYKIADFNSSIGKLSGGSDDNPFGDMVSSMVKSSVSAGFGLYLLVIAGVATAICAYAIKNRPAKPQSTPPATPPAV
ncbi:MAG TPA: hypothetical protein VHB48_04965, partial [Chitinophagaceae bacterium]|nr:hypothetical protein [Chitinophagaceae bacterium]